MFVLKTKLFLCLFLGIKTAGEFKKGQVDSFAGISYPGCINECKKNPECSIAKYLSGFHLCHLFNGSMDQSEDPHETRVKYYKKTPEETDVCQTEDKADPMCKIKTCSVPEDIPGTKMFGNMLKIGSKVKYQCLNSNRFLVKTCLENGTWSKGELFCTCQPPSQVVNGKVTYGSRRQLNVTHFILNVSCDAGYILRQDGDVICEVNTDNWTLENIYCDQVVNDTWQKVYSYPRQTDLFLLGNIRLDPTQDRELGPHGFFRNTTVFKNWETLGISKVKFNIIEREKVVAYLTFNATGSRHRGFEWFSKDRLLSSSWHDLNSSTELNMFSVEGVSGPPNFRYFINKHFEPDSLCSDDQGWFVVTWNKYTCFFESLSGDKSIIYAKNNNISNFTINEISFADRYEIWIEQNQINN